jgi:DNA polymerase-3 subunit epsilon
MRQIVLDTETTGLDPASGHRIIEIGCVELVNHVPTGRTFHCYVNPERPVPLEAFAIHGLSDAFLADKPRFAEIAADFTAFVGDTPLIIHNAAFDLGFLNAELTRIGRSPMPAAQATDTVQMARARFPAAPASLDALCRRFAIDLSDRSQHGALKDAKLLAEVYLQLIGGREPTLALAARAAQAVTEAPAAHRPRLIQPTAAEAAAHAAFLARLKGQPLWDNPPAVAEVVAG